MDVAAAERAAAELLRALGADLGQEGLRETPRRMAAAYAELLTPQPFDMTTFPNEEDYDELVLVRDISFQSLCMHHLLPFGGEAHVAYLPGETIIGISKLARVVEAFSRDLQLQERMTVQIADWLERELAPRGVAVVLSAEHTCMTIRGVRKPGARTVTSAVRGALLEDPRTRQELFSLVGASE
ncbi:MAG: GTP cyclohydrolase I FolE [Solirubrobacteraceae bacterium]